MSIEKYSDGYCSDCDERQPKMCLYCLKMIMYMAIKDSWDYRLSKISDEDLANG
jgi:hypothetical protein